jgi:hypothetical protein
MHLEHVLVSNILGNGMGLLANIRVEDHLDNPFPVS